MNTDDAHIFLKLANVLSFSKASKLLGIPVATVSRRFAQLEERLGVKLLERNTRQLQVTDVGRGYLRYCERIVEEVNEAENYINQIHGEPNGTLRVSMSVDIAQSYLKRALMDFIADYPSINLEIDVTPRQVNLIDENCDVAIRVGELKDSTLIARKLFQVELGLFCCKGFYDEDAVPTHPNQLNPKHCLRFSANKSYWQFYDDKKTIKVNPDSRLSISNLDMIKSAVQAGIGIAFLPKIVLNQTANDPFQMLLDEFVDEKIEVHAVYPSRNYMPTKVKVFLDYLKNHLHQNSD